MRVLGLSGSLNTAAEPWIRGLPRGFFHDAAAVLIEDGLVVAAVEEERLNRVKHTHAFPERAIRQCLAGGGLSLTDVDEVAFFFEEGYLDAGLAAFSLPHPDLELTSARQRIATLLGDELPAQAITFVSHHLAHAAGAVHNAGSLPGLVLVMDGSGERDSMSLFSFDGTEYKSLATQPETASLGQLYFHGTRFLGFQLFDEYKVMGLAPYGDPRRYRALFAERYELCSDGGYRMDYREFDAALLQAGVRPRRRGEPLRAQHRDFAAALQEVLEVIVAHVLADAVLRTGLSRLYLAGGVAQNCTLNGRLAVSGRFESIYVDPVPHDAGTALGAAAHVAARHGGLVAARRTAVDLGKHIGDRAAISSVLDRWRTHLDYEEPSDLCRATAELLADGAIVGWVQGRAEFGSRALGQRSILAHPGPAENRDRVNAEFMSFCMPVRPEWRARLGAVTHVDGSARVQIVRREHRVFYELVRAFGELAGIPIVLNTSFNNEAEPIVDDATDALRCFLTSEIDHLVIGPFVVRRSAPQPNLTILAPVLSEPAAITIRPGTDGQRWELCEYAQPHDQRRRRPVSRLVGELLTRADGSTPLSSLVQPRQLAAAAAELAELWRGRLVDLRPVGPASANSAPAS